MDTALFLKALFLGIVEGLTEFLPISSTGHLVVAGELVGATGERWDVFKIVIQTGAMLAVLWEYRARFLGAFTGLMDAGDRGAVLERRVGGQWVAVEALYKNRSRRFFVNLVIAFCPAAVLGLLFSKSIKLHLFHAVPVAIAFIVGGFIIFWAEKRRHRIRINDVDEMGWKDALKVGFAQCFALIPGTSRSGATIIGGMFFGLSRKAATEFSFFLAVPTLVAAGLYDLWKHRELLSAADVPVFGVGSVAAFASAFVVVRWLIRYVATHDFRPFAWYRIAFGALVLFTAYSGWIDWTP